MTENTILEALNTYFNRLVVASNFGKLASIFPTISLHIPAQSSILNLDCGRYIHGVVEHILTSGQYRFVFTIDDSDHSINIGNSKISPFCIKTDFEKIQNKNEGRKILKNCIKTSFEKSKKEFKTLKSLQKDFS